MFIQIYNSSFKSYNNGYYTFHFDGEPVTFEKINTKVL